MASRCLSQVAERLPLLFRHRGVLLTWYQLYPNITSHGAYECPDWLTSNLQRRQFLLKAAPNLPNYKLVTIWARHSDLNPTKLVCVEEHEGLDTSYHEVGWTSQPRNKGEDVRDAEFYDDSLLVYRHGPERCCAAHEGVLFTKA